MTWGGRRGFAKKPWGTWGLENQGLVKPQLQKSPHLLEKANPPVALIGPLPPQDWDGAPHNRRHTCTRLLSGMEVMVLKLVLSLSRHAGTYLSKRIVKLAFSD